MRLSWVSVSNFRAIENIQFSLEEFTTLIGPNNACKSSVLKAIQVFLSTSLPTIEDWPRQDGSLEMMVEGRFADLQPWERDRPGVAGLVYLDEIRLRMTATWNPETGKASTAYEAYVAEEDIAGFSDNWADVSAEIKELAATIGIANGTLFRSVANKERVRQQVRQSRPDLITRRAPTWSADSVSIKPALQQALPQPILIPAVRDALDETQPAAKTAFGTLLRSVLLPAVTATQQFRSFRDATEELSGSLQRADADNMPSVAALQQFISDRLAELMAARVVLTLDAPDLDKFLLSGFGLKLDDGVATPVTHQGHGLQRALVFALLDALAHQDVIVPGAAAPAESRAMLLLFEEPEIFLHPHMIRKMKGVLKQVSGRPTWQCVVTTHSPFLIDVADNPRSLVIMRRPQQTAPPVSVQLAVDPFVGDHGLALERDALRAAIDFHPSVCEAFFAKRAVLVEGASEVAILRHQPTLAALLREQYPQLPDVTVVSCGGKWTIAPIARLLGLLGIPFRVIHDLDRKGRTDAELAAIRPIDPYRANERIAQVAPQGSIFVCDDTLEDLLYVNDRPDYSKDKPYRAWCRVRDLAGDEAARTQHTRFGELVSFAFGFEN